jgi:hypothetical protein
MLVRVRTYTPLAEPLSPDVDGSYEKCTFVTPARTDAERVRHVHVPVRTERASKPLCLQGLSPLQNFTVNQTSRARDRRWKNLIRFEVLLAFR